MKVMPMVESDGTFGGDSDDTYYQGDVFILMKSIEGEVGN